LVLGAAVTVSPLNSSEEKKELNKKKKNVILFLGQQVESVSPVKRQAPETLAEGKQVKRR